MTYQAMTICQLARVCQADWKNVYFGAKPYLDAMRQMSQITDKFGEDDGKSIVLYFLSNATTWRGEVAREVKAELKRRLK